jgi:hypothetical protein
LPASAGENTLHYYSVDAVGNKEPVRDSAVRVDVSAPSAPSLSADQDATGVVLSWSASTDEVSGMDRYEVYDAGSGLLVGTTGALSYRPAGLVSGVSYRFLVRAVDAAGNRSAASNTVSLALVGAAGGTGVAVEGITVTFSSLDSPGIVTVQTSTDPVAGQTGFQLNGVYYDISTTAAYSGSVIVTLPYDPSTVADPLSLRLYHHDAALASWVDITTGVDTTNRTISGTTTSFSWFAAGRPKQVFKGFGSPLVKNQTLSYTMGQTLPVKFQLTDQGGAYLTKAVARLFVAPVTGGTVGAEQPGRSSLRKSDNLFRYSKSDNQYVFNLQTQTLSPGLWRLRVVLDDGLSYIALVLLSPA